MGVCGFFVWFWLVGFCLFAFSSLCVGCVGFFFFLEGGGYLFWLVGFGFVRFLLGFGLRVF